MNLFIEELFENPLFYIATIVAALGSVSIHEFSHATVAHWLGDDTAKQGGFQTVNPFKVMGWHSIACLLLFGVCWGAVPVMPEDSNRWRKSAIALAGPLSNLLLLLLAALGLRATLLFAGRLPELAHFFQSFLIVLIGGNAWLFLFNILPIPALDGWHIVEAILPKSLIPKPAIKNLVFWVLIVLLFSGAFEVVDNGVEWLVRKILPETPATAIAADLVAQGDECATVQDWKGAFRAYSAAVEQGNPLARGNVGICLATGNGAVPNPKKAFEMLDDDTVLEVNLGARTILATMLVSGEGCERNPERAFSLVSDPEVYNNLPDARFLLAMCYFSGEGTKQDFNKAAQHLQSAAEAGSENAQSFLGYQNGRLPDYGMPLADALREMWMANH